MTKRPRAGLITTAAALLAPGLATMVLVACEQAPPFEPSTRSKTEVKLPPKPELKVPSYELRHDDGTLTVTGLLKHRDEFLGHEVTVRGVVSELTLCPIPKPEVAPGTAPAANAPPPKPPRWCNPKPMAYLKDEGGSDEWRLLVAGSMRSPLASLELGKMARVTGRFDYADLDGKYIRQQGLVFLEDLPGTEPEKPPAAPAPAAAPPKPAPPAPRPGPPPSSGRVIVPEMPPPSLPVLQNPQPAPRPPPGPK